MADRDLLTRMDRDAPVIRACRLRSGAEVTGV